MIVIGIDPGASCGIAAVTESHVAWTTASLPSWRGYSSPAAAWVDHWVVMHEAIAGLVRETLWSSTNYVVKVAVEDSRHAKGPQHAAMQGWHIALAASLANTMACSCVPVAPSTWQWGLVGAQGRHEYLRFAREITGGELTEREHDAAAAICIAEWAYHAGDEQA